MRPLDTEYLKRFIGAGAECGDPQLDEDASIVTEIKGKDPDDTTCMISVNGIEGFLFSADVSFLRALAIGRNRILEIGSFQGLSASIMLRANRRLVLTCIDAWHGFASGRASDTETRALFESNLKGVGVWDRVTLLRGRSALMVPPLPDESFDAAWIDADHSEEGAFADMKMAWPKVASGGLMTGHDATPESSVHLALDEFCRINNVMGMTVPRTHGIWFIKKP